MSASTSPGLETITPMLDPSEFNYDPSQLGDMTIAEVFPDPNTWLPAYLQFGKPLTTMSDQSEMIATVLFGCLFIVVIIYTIIHLNMNLKRGGGKKNWAPLFILLGSLLALPYECWDCVTLHCLYPQVGTINIMNIWGMTCPLFLGFIYPCYVSFAINMMFDWIERGVFTGKIYWIFAICNIVGAFLFEPLALYFGWWNYWGYNAPFRIFDFPFIWFITNPAMITVVGPFVHDMWCRTFDRKHDWLLLFAAPMSVWGIHIVLLAPTQWAINTTLNMTIVNTCGVISCALSVLVLIWGHQLTVKGADYQRKYIVEHGLDLEEVQHPWKARKARKAAAEAK